MVGLWIRNFPTKRLSSAVTSTKHGFLFYYIVLLFFDFNRRVLWMVKFNYSFTCTHIPQVIAFTETCARKPVFDSPCSLLIHTHTNIHTHIFFSTDAIYVYTINIWWQVLSNNTRHISEAINLWFTFCLGRQTQFTLARSHHTRTHTNKGFLYALSTFMLKEGVCVYFVCVLVLYSPSIPIWCGFVLMQCVKKGKRTL